MNHRGGSRALPPAMPTPSPEDDFTIVPASERRLPGPPATFANAGAPQSVTARPSDSTSWRSRRVEELVRQ
jgi:hypothetical protein